MQLEVVNNGKKTWAIWDTGHVLCLPLNTGYTCMCICKNLFAHLKYGCLSVCILHLSLKKIKSKLWYSHSTLTSCVIFSSLILGFHAGKIGVKVVSTS